MRTNDTVKFKNETPEELESRKTGIVMRIVWIDGPRAMLESQIPGMTINPTQIVDTADIESAPLTVTLEAKPNPDYDRSDERARIRVKAHAVHVANLQTASILCRQFIEKHNLGSGNWTGGDVYYGDLLIANVSYNGRIWEPLPYPQAKEIQL